MSTLNVPARFNGPPDVVNGGYACASVAALLGGAAQVTLRRPVPVETELVVERDGDRAWLATPGGELLAEAVPGRPELPAPEAATLEEAHAAMQRSPAHQTGADDFPCFVCSPFREDGFRVSPGPLEGREAVAAVWHPGAELADAEGRVDPRFVWAVLDCTGSFGAMRTHDVPDGVLLGRMTAELRAPLRAGESYVAVGRSFPADGRKLPASAALFRADGECAARAQLLCFPPRR